jgi:membrane-bound lytic murein transglycosylase
MVTNNKTIVMNFKKTDVTFIFDLVEKQVNKNPNGLISKDFAYQLENYIKKYCNTKSQAILGIIDDLIQVQVNNKPKTLNSIYSLMFTMKEFSNKNIKCI